MVRSRNASMADSERWRHYQSTSCARPHTSDNAEERAVLTLLSMQWCREAIERYESRWAQTFDAVAYARPDFLFHAPVVPWCHWAVRKEALHCLGAASHVDAFWVAPRAKLAVFTDESLSLHASCSLAAQTRSHRGTARLGSCCGPSAEQILQYAIRTSLNASSISSGSNRSCHAGSILRAIHAPPVVSSLQGSVQTAATVSNCSLFNGSTALWCHRASNHVCDVALSNQHASDAHYRYMMWMAMELPPETGQALRRLFGMDRSACRRALRLLGS